MPQEADKEQVVLATILVDLVKGIYDLNTSSIRLAEIIQRINTIFMSMALGITGSVMLVMGLLSYGIVRQISMTETQITERLDKRADEIVNRVLTINQNVHIDRQKGHEDLVDEELKRRAQQQVVRHREN